MPWVDCLDAYANFFPNNSPVLYSHHGNGEVILIYRIHLHVDKKLDYYNLKHGHTASVPQCQTMMDVPLEVHVEVKLELMKVMFKE